MRVTLLAGELLLPAVARSDAGKSATDHRSEVIIHHGPVVSRQRVHSDSTSIGHHMADWRRAGPGWLIVSRIAGLSNNDGLLPGRSLSSHPVQQSLCQKIARLCDRAAIGSLPGKTLRKYKTYSHK